MNIIELAEEYRRTYLKLEEEIKSLKTSIKNINFDLTRGDLYLLQKKIIILEEMAMETKSTYITLKNYYERK